MIKNLRLNRPERWNTRDLFSVDWWIRFGFSRILKILIHYWNTVERYWQFIAGFFKGSVVKGPDIIIICDVYPIHSPIHSWFGSDETIFNLPLRTEMIWQRSRWIGQVNFKCTRCVVVCGSQIWNWNIYWLNMGKGSWIELKIDFWWNEPLRELPSLKIPNWSRC